MLVSAVEFAKVLDWFIDADKPSASSKLIKFLKQLSRKTFRQPILFKIRVTLKTTDHDQPQTPPNASGVGTRRWDWFGRRLLAGLLVAAAVSAVSYFILSEGVLNLIGASKLQQEAIRSPSKFGDVGKPTGSSWSTSRRFIRTVGSVRVSRWSSALL